MAISLICGTLLPFLQDGFVLLKPIACDPFRVELPSLTSLFSFVAGMNDTMLEKTTLQMSSLNATLLVLGLFLFIGGPLLYWVLFKMDEPRQEDDDDSSLPVIPLTEADITRIESTLQVRMPADYRAFVTNTREDDALDDTSVLSDADAIIESTLDYRRGFAGLPPWPETFVYIGDESDACPYAIDTASGKMVRTDKGNLQRPPLTQYASFTEFCKSRLSEEE